MQILKIILQSIAILGKHKILIVACIAWVTCSGSEILDKKYFPLNSEIITYILENQTFTEKQIETIAKSITVRILQNNGSGSGVIVGKFNNRYIVITNRHVVDGSEPNHYQVLTEDQKSHSAKLSDLYFSDLDLALLEFSSNDLYSVAKIGNSQELKLNSLIYASGFPNWLKINSQLIKSTKKDGIKTFHFTNGTFGMLTKVSFSQGYQLGYTNNVQNGMSGGAILNSKGELVGINGKSKYPLLGKSAFKFVDNTPISDADFQYWESLSWGIPSQTFKLYIDAYSLFHLIEPIRSKG